MKVKYDDDGGRRTKAEVDALDEIVFSLTVYQPARNPLAGDDAPYVSTGEASLPSEMSPRELRELARAAVMAADMFDEVTGTSSTLSES